jgi:hypothetical protein
MNNLSGFTDVINGIRQAIYSLNSQLVLLKTELEQVKDVAHKAQQQNTSQSTDCIVEVKQSLEELREQSHDNIHLLQTDVEQLKHNIIDVAKLCETNLCKCTCVTNVQEQSHNITEADVQAMIDKSLSSLLEGVQPLASLNIDVPNLEPLAEVQAPSIVVEPPVIMEPSNGVTQQSQETEAPVVAKTTKTTKRTYKKKA